MEKLIDLFIDFFRFFYIYFIFIFFSLIELFYIIINNLINSEYYLNCEQNFN
jgi:hypothetical protein